MFSTGPLALGVVTRLGATQGSIAIILAATGSKRLSGTRRSGRGYRAQLPAGSRRVEAGSNSGLPTPPKEKSPAFISGVGALLNAVTSFFSMSLCHPKKKNVL